MRHEWKLRVKLRRKKKQFRRRCDHIYKLMCRSRDSHLFCARIVRENKAIEGFAEWIRDHPPL